MGGCWGVVGWLRLGCLATEEEPRFGVPQSGLDHITLRQQGSEGARERERGRRGGSVKTEQKKQIRQ